MIFLAAAYLIVLGSIAGYTVWLARRRAELTARLAASSSPPRTG